MKKLILLLLCVPLIFLTSCEEDTPTSPDVVGIWNYIGHYDALGNISSFPSTAYENCELQSFITLESDGNATWTDYYLEDETSGPCLSQTNAFTFTHINSTTLQFIFPSSCGDPTVTLNIPTQFQIPSCSEGSWDGGYSLFELEP